MIQDQKRAGFIEEAGLFFESLGMTRMAGRIQGYLMVADKDMVSFDELTQDLQASKSSISNNLKALVQTRFIKPVSLPGDRKTYYCLTPDINWTDYFEHRMIALKYMQDLFERGLDLRDNQNDKPSQWLKQTIEFYSWLLREFPALIKQWKGLQKGKET